MAEEIVSLNGSRIEDERYQNNVIFDVDGLNELLTNIKNYPIIDIDSIDESETDELHGNLIWENYTDGTPCIKIIYGDSENTNGNLDSDDMQRIRGKKKQIELYENVMGIMHKYDTIEAEYKTLIGNVEDELNKIVESVCIQQHNLLNSTANQFLSYDPTANIPYPKQDIDEDNWGGSLFRRIKDIDVLDRNGHSLLWNDFNRPSEGNDNYYILDGLYYKINYQILPFTNYIEGWINSSNSEVDFSNCYTISYTTREATDIINPSSPSNGIYTTMPLIRKQNTSLDLSILKAFATNANINNTTNNIDSFLSNIFNDTNVFLEDNQDYINKLEAEFRAIFSKYNDEIIKLNTMLEAGSNSNETKSIKYLLTKYINILRSSRVQRYEEIRDYLIKNKVQDNNNNLQNAVTEFSTAQNSPYQKVLKYVNDNYVNTDIQTIQDEINQIISGAVDSKYEEVSAYNQNISQYYIFNTNNNRYEEVLGRLTQEDFQEQPHPTYYKLVEGEKYPAIYGYKYVKVGSNIIFNTFGGIQEITNENPLNSNNQNSGTFRVTINNHTYEVPIKGFTNRASNKPIYIKTADTTTGITITSSKIKLDGTVLITGDTTTYGDITLGNGSTSNNLLPAVNGDGNLGGFIPAAGTTYSNSIEYYIISNGQYVLASTQPTTQNEIDGNSPKYYIKKFWKNIYGVNGYYDKLIPEDSNNNGTSLGDASHIWSSAYINQIGNSSHPVQTLYADNLLPKDGSDSGNTTTTLGSQAAPWTYGYITNLGDSTTPVNNSYFNAIHIWDGVNSTPRTYVDLADYINSQVTYGEDHPLLVTNEIDGVKTTINGVTTNGFNASGTIAGDDSASISTAGGIYAAKNIWAARVFNAVFNDYAECRTTINLTPGHVVIDQDDGSLTCSSKRLQPGAQVISDTYGHLMGQTENATTPIAVAGRVLVYTYQPRENYHAGMAVCSAPDGTVDIMSRAEICEYPDCIVGIVSEIPQYETWGSDNVKVDGRIWIKVR